jgi:hypothetical protein
MRSENEALAELFHPGGQAKCDSGDQMKNPMAAKLLKGTAYSAVSDTRLTYGVRLLFQS